jgi:hypothetical protein
MSVCAHFRGSGGKEQPVSKTSAYARFRGRRWCWQRTTALENKRSRLFSREKGGGDKEQPVEGGGWWWWQITTVLENKRTRLFSREKGGGKEQPASKTSIHARFRERREVVVAKREKGGGGKTESASKTSRHARF